MQIIWWIFVIGLVVLGSLAYVEKICNRHLPHWVHLVLFILFLVMSVGQIPLSLHSEKELNARIATLNRENQLRAANETSLNKELEGTRQELQGTKNELKLHGNFLKYSEAASFTLNGDSFSGNRKSKTGMQVSTPVSDWFNGHGNLDGNNKFSWKCERTNIDHYKKVINTMPDFPFPYYTLAYCLKQNGKDDWKSYADKGIDIFTVTTAIPNHAPEHDSFFQEIKKLRK